MKLKSARMILQLEKDRLELALADIEQTAKGIKYLFQKETESFVQGSLVIEEQNGVWVFTARALLAHTPFREDDSLEAQSPLLIIIEPEQLPEKLCAQYQHRDWWSRPFFEKAYGNVPERTQSLFVRYESGVYGCFLPMAGSNTKSYLQGGPGGTLAIRTTAYTGGLQKIEDICLLYAEGPDFYKNTEKIWREACLIRQIPGKPQRRYAEMFEYLGWCSWDAFYTDITEGKVREKARELESKKLPVRWLLLDDGWLSVEGQRLYAFEPEKEKFPHGFQEMIGDIKANSMISHVGVWHAFGGYWGGIMPGSVLAGQCRENLYETKNEKLLPHFDPEKGSGFWHKWYHYLRNQGIDFVKVDGQSALKNYYRHHETIGKVAKGAHEALESAASLWMDGNLINCMGMAIENILSRPASGLSRNSDDFMPEIEGSFREHVLQNAYNALYHSMLYHCDWDMFWTKHKDARKHALVRAISGGPVYISDKIGETDADEITPLIYHDGRILRMDRCALPAISCIFDSPMEGNNLMLTNTVNGTGAAALFHICEKDDEQTSYIKPSHIHDLNGENFLFYRFFTGEWMIAGRDKALSVTLKKDAYALVLFIPKRKGVTPIGLLDKYMSCHSLKDVRDSGSSCSVTLRDGGLFAFHVDHPSVRIEVNGEDMTGRLQWSGNIGTLALYHIHGEIAIRITIAMGGLEKDDFYV